MIITNQPATQQILDKEIKDIDRQRRIKSPTNTEDAPQKSLFAKQDIADPKLSLIEQKLGELTNKLLAGLKAGEQGPNTPKALQVAPNLASDVKDLIKQMSGNDKLAPLKAELEKFIQPVENLKNMHSSEVAKTFQNSGIMLEAKIAQSLEPQALPTKIKELLSLMKNTTSSELKDGFLRLPNDSDAKKSISDLTKLLDDQKAKNLAKIEHSGYKELFKASASLENAVKYLDKLSNLKGDITTKEAQKIIAQLEKNIDNAQKTANNYNLNSNSLKNARQIREQINQTANELKTAISALKNGDANFKNSLVHNKSSNQNLNANLSAALKTAPNSAQSTPQSTSPNVQQNQAQNTQNSAQNSTLNAQNPQGSGIRINMQTSNISNPTNANVAGNSTLNENSAPNQANQTNQTSQTSQTNQSNQANQNSTLNNATTQNAAQNAAQNTAQNSPQNFFTNQQNTLQSSQNMSIWQFKEAIAADVNGANLQGKISDLAKNLASLTSTLSSEGTKAKQNLNEISALTHATKAAAKQIGQISSTNAEEAAKSLQNDFKSVLLNLKESTQNSASMQNINATATRLLAQIEIHQLASFSQNTLQTYLPYSWDELDSSHVSFKRGNKDKFYARIELSFVKFGEVSVVLGLSENKYLDVSIQLSKDSFKDAVLSETKNLKKSLNDEGLIVNNFFLSTKKNTNAYEKIGEVDLGYSVKA